MALHNTTGFGCLLSTIVGAVLFAFMVRIYEWVTGSTIVLVGIVILVVIVSVARCFELFSDYKLRNPTHSQFSSNDEGEQILKIIVDARYSGKSYGQVAKELNKRGFKTKNGSQWYAINVKYVEQVAINKGEL